MTHDPERWLDPESDASDALRAVLDSARDDATPEQRERLEARLGAALGWGAASAAAAKGAAAATTTGAAKGGVLKASLIVTAALAVTAGGGVIGYRALSSEPTPEPGQVSEPAPPDPTPPPAEEEAVRLEEPPAPEPEAAEAPAEAPAPRRAAQPRAPRDHLASEVALLGEVQRIVDSNPRRALRLLGQHRRRYPDGTLVEEREFFMVQALWGAGRRDAARGRARRFLEAHPSSPHAPRLRRLVGE